VSTTASPPRRLQKRLLAYLAIMALVLTACSPAAPERRVRTPPPPSASPSKSSTPSPSKVTSSAIASISFDDGTIGHYTYARPVMRKNDLPGTYYIVSDALGWGSSTMNAQQVKKLADEGDEIGNHTRTHANLDEVTTAQAAAEFADAQDAIESQVGVRPTTCAYPQGSSNDKVRALAEKQFKGCRSTQGGLNERGDLITYNLYSYYVQRDTTADEILEAAEQALATNTWIIFVYHGVDPEKDGQDDVTPKVFAAHMKAIVSSGIDVQTVESALATMSGKAKGKA
jgi:peptidoglycan/xylan/chitin deacetylase (PgdA/CDA1 family)